MSSRIPAAIRHAYFLVPCLGLAAKLRYHFALMRPFASPYTVLRAAVLPSLALALLIAQPARADGTAKAALPVVSEVGAGKEQVLTLGYNVYLGGLHIFAFTTDIALANESYSIKGRGESRGIIQVFWRWAAKLAVGGTIGPEGVRPQIYNVDTFRERRNRSMQLSFDQGGKYTTRRMPVDTPHRAAKRQLPDLVPAGTIDPLSVAMLIGRNVANGKGCNVKLPVFDGNRQYDLSFTDLGKDVVTPTHYSVFAGEAHRCQFKMKRVSGFRKPRTYMLSWNEGVLDPPEVWVAKLVPQIPPVPVRMDGDLNLGALRIYLVWAEFAGKPLFAGGVKPDLKQHHEKQTSKE
ncbi:MAG: hypothetical protein ACI82H_001747 [Alphaproteobacteria bacterium]|jgi:hypothetical protein